MARRYAALAAGSALAAGAALATGAIYGDVVVAGDSPSVVSPLQSTVEGRNALSIDDIPWSGPAPPTGSLRDRNRRLLAALEQRHVPVAGFVRCAGLGDGRLLSLWQDAAATLGNHSFNHLDLNSTPLSQWLDDVARCDSVLAARTGGRPLYFRYPYLHRGATRAIRDSARAALHARGHRIAPVSVDNSEWLLVRPYVEAIAADDSARAAAIGRAYVDHIIAAVRHFQDVARARLGRDIDQVLLLHANALNVDHIGTLLDELAAAGFEFITLEEALRDPVYARPDGYVGRKGLSWLYRFEPATPEAAEWDDGEAARLREAWGSG